MPIGRHCRKIVWSPTGHSCQCRACVLHVVRGITNYTNTPKIRNTFLFLLHECRSMLLYTNIANVVIFASTMYGISQQHLHASSFCTCSKVHICTGCSVYLGRWIQPTAKFVLNTEVHARSIKYLCRFNVKISKSFYCLFTPVQHTADSNI